MTITENEMAPTSPVGATSEALTRDLNVAENDHFQATSPEDSVNQLTGFTEESLAELVKSGIPMERAAEFGITPVRHPDDVPAEIHRRQVQGAGMLFQWRDRDRTVPQFRPDVPTKGMDGEEQKYVFPKGCGSLLGHLREAADGEPVLFVEGAKQGVSAAIWAPEGWGVVAVPGCQNWAGTDLSWAEDRKVICLFDSDVATNRNVWEAADDLKEALESEGADSVLFASLAGAKSKEGLDDVLGRRPEEKRTPYIERICDAAKKTLPKRPAGKTKRGTEDHNGQLTDAFMADTVAEEVLSNRFAWTRGAGWLTWDGRKWDRCEVTEAVNAVRKYVISRFEELLTDMKEGRRSGGDLDAIDGWKDLLKANRLKAVTGLAQAIVARDDAELDANPDLLNVLNGVVDLRTGELRPHDPALMMTRLAGAEYDAFAESEAWNKILGAIPEDTREYLQVRAGQAATGHRTPDDVVPLLNGGGENGKSTWAAGLAGALGTYHVLMPDALLIGGAQRDESMTLRGARFALIEETPEAAHLNSTMLKKSTSPEMTGHHLYQSETSWQTTHSLFITTNYKPVVTETDHGTWRRLELIEFPYRFTSKPSHEDDRQGDPTLRNRVEAGDPEILGAALSWIVTGAMRWYGKDKLLPEQPGTVQAATRSWREETDLILAYWGERLEPDHRSHVMSSDLLADFNKWADRRKQKGMSERGFSPKFEAHSETRAARVTKGNIRRTEGLSRPGPQPEESGTTGNGPFTSVGQVEAGMPVPDRYRGWQGVRFRSSE